MCPDDKSQPERLDVPPPVERLLTGLWRQREDLGLIADELLDIFKRHGLEPPRDQDSK